MEPDTFDNLYVAEAVGRVAAGELAVLDVRQPEETAAYRIPGAQCIPLPELLVRAEELDPDTPWLVVCEHGIRSITACALLAERGFARLYNLRQGMCAWTGPVEGRAVRLEDAPREPRTPGRKVNPRHA